jgi:hypothetical protein
VPSKAGSTCRIKINRAPVLTLWAAVVAERFGFDRDEALTLGRAVAGLNAYAKGQALGLFKPKPKEVKEKRAKLEAEETISVDLLHRAVPAKQTDEGLRALSKGKPIDPASVERYLESKFGEALGPARDAMKRLARSRTPAALDAEAYHLYEEFRPGIPAGLKGWGAAGWLDFARVEDLAR